MSNLDAKCLIVNFTTAKGWKQTGVNRQASKEIVDQKSAKRNSAKVVVKLFQNSVADSINTLLTATRNQLARFTLPTDNPCKFLVPTEQFFTVSELLNDAAAKLDLLKAKIIPAYAEFVNSEAKRLADLFNPENYASAQSVVDKTFIAFSFEPLPTANRFADLFTAESIVIELTKQHDNRLSKLADASRQHLHERLDTAIDKAVATVRAFHNGGERLHTAGVNKKLKTIVSDVAGLNFDNDAELIAKLDAVLAALPVDPERLKVAAVAESFCNALRPLPVVEPAIVEPAAPAVEPVTVELIQPAAPIFAELPQPAPIAAMSLDNLPSVDSFDLFA